MEEQVLPWSEEAEEHVLRVPAWRLRRSVSRRNAPTMDSEAFPNVKRGHSHKCRVCVVIAVELPSLVPQGSDEVTVTKRQALE
jgi:hypothetical protein